MAKNGQTAAATGPALDWRQLAQPVKAVAPAPVEPIMGGPSIGHNLVIDRRVAGALSIHIATDEQAFAEIFQAEPSKEKRKEDPNAVGARYLARTTGPMYGSVPLDIDGRRFYLKLTLEEAKAKK